MNILFVSAEVSPFAKVGGLADVAGSLPKALKSLGHDVRIVMPHYGMIAAPKQRFEADVQLNGNWSEQAQISESELDGVPVYFVGHDRFFKGATSSDKIYTAGIEQYLFFSAAVTELPSILGWTPDVIHCNDWHTGFIPVLMRERHAKRFENTGAIFTIHNLAYQGEFGIEILDALALPRSLFVPDKLETWGGVNFLKSGCAYSDQVNTVSPTYAREIQTPEFGCKLEGLMRHLAADGRLSGILNGIDTDTFNPASDAFLPANFSAGAPEGKQTCREGLLEEIGLAPIKGAPLVGAVTRLSNQKGLDLLIAAAPRLFDLPIQLVIQGLGDPAIIAGLQSLQNDFPEQIRFIEKFDEDLAHRIYAGSDLFAMPSMFEPCGLGQMISMRYGTVPVVRATGGLADTVFEGRNGFVFLDKSEQDLVATFARAQKTFNTPKAWASLRKNAIDGDYGWGKSAQTYVEIYRKSRVRELTVA